MLYIVGQKDTGHWKGESSSWKNLATVGSSIYTQNRETLLLHHLEGVICNLKMKTESTCNSRKNRIYQMHVYPAMLTALLLSLKLKIKQLKYMSQSE